jgi:hypothetical protein
MGQMMQAMPEHCRAMMQNMSQNCMSMMQQMMRGQMGPGMPEPHRSTDGSMPGMPDPTEGMMSPMQPRPGN